MMQTWAKSAPFGTSRWLLENLRASFYSFLSFITLIAINSLQCASLLVLPFSRRAFKRVNRWCANSWWGLMLLGAERINGYRAEITGDAAPIEENALVVVNHQQMPDVIALWPLARSKGRLGDLKWFIKHGVKYVPGVGWGMQFLDTLFVKRAWESDQEMIAATFNKYNREKIPMWLVSFVEGTRITPAKLAKSQEFARKNGLWEPRHLMIPRTKGFVASVGGLRGHLTAVYDVTIAYPDGIPSLWQFTQGYGKRVALHLRRYPIAEIPHDETELARWLMDRFQEKDQLLANYFAHGRFKV